jgi:hypothetical protein
MGVAARRIAVTAPINPTNIVRRLFLAGLSIFFLRFPFCFSPPFRGWDDVASQEQVGVKRKKILINLNLLLINTRFSEALTKRAHNVQQIRRELEISRE